MTRERLVEGLTRCADEMERGITEFRARHDRGEAYSPGVAAEALLDTQGRPILAGLYAQLAEVYAALERLTPETSRPTPDTSVLRGESS